MSPLTESRNRPKTDKKDIYTNFPSPLLTGLSIPQSETNPNNNYAVCQEKNGTYQVSPSKPKSIPRTHRKTFLISIRYVSLHLNEHFEFLRIMRVGFRFIDTDMALTNQTRQRHIETMHSIMAFLDDVR